MGVLLDGPRKAAAAAWEEGQQAVKALLLPLPPDDSHLKGLPINAPPCTPQTLLGMLGPVTVSALVGQVAAPAVQAAIQENLDSAKTQLMAYLSQMEGEIGRLTAELPLQQEALQVAEQAHTALGGVRGALSLNGAIPAAQLAQVRTACPAMGAFLDHAESAITQAESAVTQAEQVLQGAEARLQAALDMKAQVQAQLDRLDAQLTALPQLIGNILEAAP